MNISGKVQSRKLKSGRKTTVKVERCVTSSHWWFFFIQFTWTWWTRYQCLPLLQFDQFSVALFLKQSGAGGVACSWHTHPRHWRAWCCSEGTAWGSCAIWDRDNVAGAVPKSLLGWCCGQGCGGAAALHSQAIRQTRVWTISSLLLSQSCV